MGAIRTSNYVLAFLLEIAALVALAVWGFTVAPNLVLRLVLGLGAPAVLVAVWGLWLAPTSDLNRPGFGGDSLVESQATRLVRSPISYRASNSVGGLYPQAP